MTERRMRGEPKANVLIAAAADAAQGASAATADGVNGIEFAGVFAEAIAALHYALIGREFEPSAIDYDILAAHAEVFVYTELHGGWLYEFPPDFVQKMATTNAAEQATIAEAWWPIYTDDGCPPTFEELVLVVGQIAELARRSLQERKRLYWLQGSC